MSTDSKKNEKNEITKKSERSKKTKKFEKSDKSNKSKKISLKLVIFTILLILLILFLIFVIYKFLTIKNTTNSMANDYINFVKNNENPIFSIDKIVYFSSADSKFKTSSQTNFTIENLYTYTDIAIFLNNNSSSNDFNMENTLKSLRIENIKFNTTPKLGTLSLYYKDLNKFANSEFQDTNKIENSLDFTITSLDSADLSTPVLYNNCANPICLSLVNQNIKTDYTITDTSIPITYSGLLLNTCQVSLEDIACSLSFDIYIENNNDEKFKTTIYLDIPYTDETSSILDGSITVSEDTDFIFYKYDY